MADVTQKIKNSLLTALQQVEHDLSMAKYKTKEKLHLLDPITIMPYYGFGNDTYVYVKGRVLENEKLKKPKDEDSTLTHLVNTYKRYESDEIPGIKLTATFAGQKIELQTDEEGFFEVEFRTDAPFDYSSTGYKIKLTLQEQKTAEDRTEAEAHVFVPGEDAEFGIISDIDDTVLVSKIAHFLERLKLMLTKNATERSPFSGIAGFLRALCRGSDNSRKNPLFFVSGSEWNLYDLLISFFRSHNIPEGPLFLRDKGISLNEGYLETSGQAYKRDRIRHILDTYPSIQFICIGDSGQHDPEIYQQVAQEYPGRILGIYIRDVTPNKRDNEVQTIAEQVKAQGVEMKLVEETYSAAKHAVTMGWINEDQLEDVKQACEKDEQQEH
ncbi:App1 family protein [Pontibacter pamirensis]|uniref:App1 family protein n=1 Tax=Pontibacter pamirensis TaxID=2562824 RepID=UPI001389B125|nr:phosphatase domain-containing protein [Pontibacter pamirensis]